jgi:hypothetical protein
MGVSVRTPSRTVTAGMSDYLAYGRLECTRLDC